MTNIDNQSGQETLAISDRHPIATRSPRNNVLTNKNALFGNDGFTFFDFLDIINPLQHLPIISTIYRSITGDQIDPGSRIAGATLFGGPLGGALASMDVAIKHNTGLDIVEHTATFFTGGGVSNQKAKNLRVMPLAAPVSNGTIEKNPAQIASLVTQHLELGAKGTSPDKFHFAGMTAIPLAKNNTLSLKEPQQAFKTTGHELKIMVEEKKPTTPPFVTNKMFNETINPNLNAPGIKQPQALTPRFSARTVRGASVPLNISDTKVNENLGAREQNKALTRENWVIDAMLKGLGKYTSAKKLTKNPHRPVYSVNH
ncbi:hypothetical protein OAJ77_00170 [Rhodospirillales bacterium]|nr:hypothetical protein [Rhodospirillales bacterium]